MKLSKNLCWMVIGLLCVGGILFFSGKLFWQNSDKAMTSTQNTAYLLQEANDLYGQWARTQDNHLIRQATDKYTLWLQNNWNNSDKNLVAKTLRSRANAFTVLNEPNKAIHDFEKSIEYDPNGLLQLIVCDLKEKQGDLPDARSCYSKAVAIFEKTKTPQKDVEFLLARIWSGDKSAVADYKKFYKDSTGRERKIYEMNAQGFLDKATYEEIVN